MASALKFDLHAHPPGQHKKSERCIRNFVAKDTLVVVTATVGGTRGDGQEVNIHVCALQMDSFSGPSEHFGLSMRLSRSRTQWAMNTVDRVT